jgi:predicted O-methyltransferase YrrM
MSQFEEIGERYGMDFKNAKPWIPPAAIDYYENLLNEKSRVLEYGAGYSTLWLAQQGVAEVISLESDPEWYAALKDQLEDYPNVTLIFAEDYHEKNYIPDREDHSFDVIMIDGIFRSKCLAKVLNSKLLAEGGVIAYDDAERRLQGSSQAEHQADFDSLENKGFIMNYMPRSNPDPLRIPVQTLFAVSTEKIKKPRKTITKSQTRGRSVIEKSSTPQE